MLEGEIVAGVETSIEGLNMGEKLVVRNVDIEVVVVIQLADPCVLDDGKDELLGPEICRGKYLEVGIFCFVFYLRFDADVGFCVLHSRFF